MTGAARTALRASVASAITTAHPDLTRISAWVQTVDSDRLPAFAVATPTERHDRNTIDDIGENSLTLLVMLKRADSGADIEDALDDDADDLAPLVLTAVQSAEVDCELTETAIRVDRTGQVPIGTLTLQFTVTSWVAPA